MVTVPPPVSSKFSPLARWARFSLCGFLAGSVCVFATLPARGQEVGAPGVRARGPVDDTDPSDLFLKAFTAVQQAENSERDGKMKQALSKYRFAASLLEQISQNHPNWQPLIVGYRARKTSESLSKLQQRIGAQANSASAAIPGLNPLPGGVSPDDEDPLPEPDRPGGAQQPSGASARPGNANANPPRSDASVGRAAQEARSKIEKLQDELKNTRKQLDVAQKERKQLQDQLENAQGDLKTANKNAERTRADRDEIETQLAKVQSRLKEVSVKNPDAAAESRKELRRQLAELRDKLDKAETAAKTAAREKEAVAAKLAAATRKNAAGTTGELPKEVSDRLETLAAENAALTQKLAVAERTIVDLNAEAAKKKEEAEAVQVELTKLRQQYADARDKNDRSETQIVELKKQLDDGADRMNQGLPKEEAAKLAKENDLLRGIALRLLKQQAVRAQARKLLGDELARLEVQSKTLTEQLDLLGQPTLQLTDEERALFRDPLINISDNSDPSTLAASIVAISPGRSPDGAPNPEAATAKVPGDPAAAASPPATDATAAASGAPPPPAPPPPVPEELVPLAREARDNLERGKFAEAESAYDKLVARAPKSVYALSNLGVVLSRQGKLKSAETKLKKAVALAPNDPFSQATLGIVYYQMRRFDDAIDSLTKAIQLDPKNASAHNYLGITSSQKGWPEAAVEELEKALALKPDYADAHFNLAVVYAINQPPAKDKAKLHYTRATQLGAAPDPQLEKLIN